MQFSSCQIFFWTLFLFFTQIVSSEKVFKSIPVTVKSYENDSVLLPCYLDGQENVIERVRWYKNDVLLGDSKDAHHLLPERTRMHANYSLQIDGLTENDTADYTCEVVRTSPWNAIKQTHSIEVQFAPTIRTIPEDGFLEVKKGDFVNIGCIAQGTPTPIVEWKKNGSPMTMLEHRARLKFKAEHRQLAGVYECTAFNGVREPVSASITLVVLDAPLVSAVKSSVHTAVGFRAALTAKVEFAEPPATVRWYFGGTPVKLDDRVITIVQDNIHELIFRKVRRSDFGNYTFRAENKFGMADVSFRLTGVPNVASFKVEPQLNKASPNSFQLLWEVDSYATIIEYNLWIRPYYHRNAEPSYEAESLNDKWSKIVVPGDSTDGPIHSASYRVHGLAPSTVYEAIVTSRNSFGWSKPSAVLRFATETRPWNNPPATTEYTEQLEPILEEAEREYDSTAARMGEKDQLTDSGGRETPYLTTIFVSVLVSLLLFK